jgi:opacity protein-like surface antigen
MKSFVIAAALALGLVSTAAHAELSNTTYKTPQSAARHGAAYKLDKAAGWGAWRASDLKIGKTIDKTPPTMKYRVVTKDTNWNNKPIHTRTMTVIKQAPAVYRFKR